MSNRKSLYEEAFKIPQFYIKKECLKSHKFLRYTVLRSTMDNKETSFDIKCEILSDLWMDHRHQEDFEDFISYNDLGLPLAFLVNGELVTPSEMAKSMINETFELFLAAMEVDDTGFDSLDDLLLG